MMMRRNVGFVTILVDVNSDGSVTPISLQEPSVEAFEKSAFAGAAKATFHPAMLNGEPLTMRFLLPIEYNLR